MDASLLTDRNIMEMWLFDTCNFRCGYCGLVTSGEVTQTDQLNPYRSQNYIETIQAFFQKNRPQQRKWVLLLTGGEPLMMPNLDLFLLGLGRNGDSAAIYTNLSTSLEKVLSKEAMGYLSYVQASFHPDWHMGKFKTKAFFSNVERAKDFGVPIVVRFVGAPDVLDLLPELERRCDEIGVSFLPTTLFNPQYPRMYTQAERSDLASFMVGFSSLIQLEGGLNMEGRHCLAADRLFATRLHKGGDITPCISTDKPILGNIIGNTLSPILGEKPCFKSDSLCSCDVHFQQNIVRGVDDSHDFIQILKGAKPKRVSEFLEWKREHAVQTTDEFWVGQGEKVGGVEDLIRVAPRK